MAPTSTRTFVRVAGAGAVVLAAGLLAACSGASSGGGPATPPPGPTTSTATATVTTSAAAPTTPSPSASSKDGNGSSDASGGSGGGTGTTGAYCKESQLRASIDGRAVPGSGSHGRKAVIVDFVNKSNSTCVLYGYPGAAVLDSSGAQVKQAERTIRGALLGYAPGHDTLVHVRLKPGAVASAGIEGTNQQERGAAQAGCEATPDPRIEVTPPNTRTAVPFTVTWPICYSFTVHPVNYS